LAFEWFNSYLATKAQIGVSLFTTAELAEIQKEMQAKMLAALQD
jgi:hypothetical protein